MSVIKLSNQDAEQVATVLEQLAATVRELNEVPSTSFQVNTSNVRIELKIIQRAESIHNCGNCRAFRRGQGAVGYCDDPRSPRKSQVVQEDARPCQSYERVHNGKGRRNVERVQ